MAPRVSVDRETFEGLVSKHLGEVIVGPYKWGVGSCYVTKAGDYYYFTTSKQPLDLPNQVTVINSNQLILLFC